MMRFHYLQYAVLASALASIGLANTLPTGWVPSPGSVAGVSGAVANLTPVDGLTFGFLDTTGSADMMFTNVPGATTGSMLLSPTFPIAAGQSLSLSLNFLTNDGEDFADFAYVQLWSGGQAKAMLYTANTTGPSDRAVPAIGGPGAVTPGVVLSPAAAYFDGQFTGLLNGIPYGPQKFLDGMGGSTGWVTSSFTVPDGGEYQLVFIVSNLGDPGLESALAIDDLRVDLSVLESFEGNATPSPVPEPNAGFGVALVLLACVLFQRFRSSHRS